MEGRAVRNNLKGTHPGTIPARFGSIWFSGFRGEDLNMIFYQNLKPQNQIKPTLAGMVPGWVPFKFVSDSPGGHLGWKSGSPDTILEGGHPRTIPPKFGSNWPSGFRGVD
jgi:hypothetical protein